jgi:hypothetical protein
LDSFPWAARNLELTDSTSAAAINLGDSWHVQTRQPFIAPVTDVLAVSVSKNELSLLSHAQFVAEVARLQVSSEKEFGILANSATASRDRQHGFT